MDGDKAQYSCLMESLKRRRRLGPDELRLIAEHDSDEDHEGMTIEEEDFMDMELLDEGEEEDEEEQDEQRDQPTTSYRLSCPMSGRKRKRFPESVSFPSYADVDTEAPEPIPFNPSRPVGIDLGSVHRAVRSATSTLREIDFFKLFFTYTIVAEICQFTNSKGWELVLNRPSYANHHGAWEEVTPDEFYRFLGLLIYMGFTSLHSIHRYWGTKSLQGSWAKLFMSRDRFKELMAALHVVDPATENNLDRLRKLRYLMDHLKTKCQQLFQADENLSIDERMVKSKGRSGFKQYMKGKPTRWGFKLWVIATSNSGYTLDFDVYTGSLDGRITDLAIKVIEDLVQPFKNQGHTVWFDNFYTSPTVMVRLKEWGINACGTCRINRKKFPVDFKDVKKWERQANRGDMRWCRIDGNVLVVQWKDTRAVTCLSNFHNANDSSEVSKMVKVGAKWDRKVVRQPAVVKDYNKHMGGVDRSDQMLNTYSLLQKTQVVENTFLPFCGHSHR